MVGVIQRVSEAEIYVDGEQVSRIGKGILLLVGIASDDTHEDVSLMADKTIHLRIFSDEQGNLNRSLLDEQGEVLVVSQFTLLGDTRKGRRPSFSDAAPPEAAESLYRALIEEMKCFGVPVKEGRFRARMEVKLTNNGPVTLIVNSKK